MKNRELAWRFRSLVAKERIRQERKFGAAHDALPVSEYIIALGEEYGEVCRAYNDNDPAHMLEELVQVAAVCQRIYETFGG